MDGSTVKKLSEIVEGVIRGTPFEIVDLRFAGNGKVSVFVDRLGGVNIGECSELSREIGVLIDIEGIMTSRYTLEVSSPGPERPLKKPGDYERFCGKLAKIRTKEILNGRKVFTGRINRTENGFIKLSDEKSGDEVFSIPFEDIEKGNLKPEL